MSILKGLWCAIFHRRYTYQESACGDWKTMHCNVCDVSWTEPR